MGVTTSPIAEATRLLTGVFREELSRWEDEYAMPRSAFELLGDSGVLRARWDAENPQVGNLTVAEALARESALVSLGVNLCVGLQSDALLPSIRLSGLGDDVYADAEAGRRVGCVALSERTSGSDVTNCETVAERVGDGWSLSGHKHYVSNFFPATDCIVFARTGRRSPVSDFTLFLVPTDDPRVRAKRHGLIGLHCSGTAAVDFDGVRISDDRRVGAVGAGLQLILTLLRRERLWAAIGGTAAAELLFEIALAFAAKRVIQGSALTAHQATRQRLATMSAAVETAKAHLRVQLDKASTGRVTSVDAARAKLVATEVLWRVADDTMQILGGRGYTDETVVSRIWRDARVARIGGGTDEVLRELVAGALRPGPLAARPEVQEASEAAAE